LRNNHRKPPNRYSPDVEDKRSRYPIANYMSTQKLLEPLKAFVYTLSSCHVPNAVQEALKDKKRANDIQEEMEALQKNETWTLVPLPKGKKTIVCKWVYSQKIKIKKEQI
jgi:hypothetical protein